MGTVTISGAVFEIYGTRIGADDYMKARLGAAAWTTATSGDKDKALVSATRLLDRQTWAGTKTSDVQPLEWPREGLFDKNGLTISGVSTPVIVEEATYELALSTLVDSSIQGKSGTGSNTKRVKAGSAEVEFFRATDGAKFPPQIMELIGIFLGGNAASDTGALVSGNEGVSDFCDPHRFAPVTPFS